MFLLVLENLLLNATEFGRPLVLENLLLNATEFGRPQVLKFEM